MLRVAVHRTLATCSSIHFTSSLLTVLLPLMILHWTVVLMLSEVTPACWRQKPDAVSSSLDVSAVPALLTAGMRPKHLSQTICSHLLQASGLAEVITEQLSRSTTPGMQHLSFTYFCSILPQVVCLSKLKLFVVPDAQMRRTQYCTQNPGNLSDHSLHFQLADSVTLPPLTILALTAI
jgi:hypothetical protein